MNLAVLERMAHDGVKEMQFVLGFLKENGLGYPVNKDEAYEWYRRSAENGFPPSAYMLFYRSHEERRNAQNTESPGDIESRLAWCRKAADGDFAPAQLDFAVRISDPHEAYKLMLSAAEKNYPLAAFCLADLHDNGANGAAPDLATAFTWFKKAADMGHANSAAEVARRYRDGIGIAKDEAAAMQWYLRAAEMKSPSACTTLSLIYTHGMLGQEVDLEKADLYRSKGKEYLKLWSESYGLR